MSISRVFHSVEVPKGSGMNYSDGITPFVLAKIMQRNGIESYIMETGFRERQAESPFPPLRVMRFEPRPGYFEPDPGLNPGRSPALSNDPRTWPDRWPDRLDDPDDPGWAGSWNGYFGKNVVADQESYTVMDDDFYDAWDFWPDNRDSTRHGLGLRIEVRGFQWANPQARNVIFWHYDITNEGTTDYNDNIIFGLYMDSGVGGSALSCDNIFESDDDNAFFDRSFNEQILNLVYTWDKFGHGRDLSGPCGRTGYLGYAYLETPGNPLDGIDNDEDGITDERRDAGPGQRLASPGEIEAYVAANYNQARFEVAYGPLADRPAYRSGVWWTGDEDMDWTPELHDVGADGLAETGDTGEGDGMPTAGEPNFDRTDLNESDQIGLTGFKHESHPRRPGQSQSRGRQHSLLHRPEQLAPAALREVHEPRLGRALRSRPRRELQHRVPVRLGAVHACRRGRPSASAWPWPTAPISPSSGARCETVQQIYNANYRFAVPPQLPTASAEAGDG